MKKILLLNLPLIALLLHACAGSKPEISADTTPAAEASSTTNAKTSRSFTSAPSTGESSATHPLFFTGMDSAWSLISDAHNPHIPLEYINRNTGTRISVQINTFSTHSLPDVSDLIASTLQAQDHSSDKIIYAKSGPININEINGMGWELAWERHGTYFQQMGTYVVAGSQLLQAQLFARNDSLQANSILQQEWKDFFTHFSWNVAQNDIPSLETHATSELHSDLYGYTWRTAAKTWHVFNRPAFDESAVLMMNSSEELSLSIHALHTDLQEVSLIDVFKIMLVRAGLPTNSPQIKMAGFKKSTGGGFSKDFEIVHEINGYDFLYRGKFHYENGRAVMISAWSQYALDKTYKSAATTAINSLSLDPQFSAAGQSAEKTAQVLNQIGLLRLLEEQPLVALSYFERANRMDPQEPLYLINCGFIYQKQNLYGPGVQHFESQINTVKQHPKLLYILGEMYESLRNYEQALHYYELALPYTPNDPELVINISDALWGVGQRHRSLAVVSELYETQPSVRLGVYVAKTLMGMDQYSEAVDLLYDVRQKFPMNRQLGLTLCEALIFLQRYAEALNISQELMSTQQQNSEFLTTRGKIQFHLNQFGAAEKTLEKSLSLDKNNEETKSYLSATKAFLGKADNRALQTKINPASPSPANLAALRSGNFVERVQKDYPAAIHWQSEALKIEANGKWVQTEEMLAEILSPAGTSYFQEFIFNFLPGYDRIYINTLDIYDQNFKLRKKWSPSEAYITYFKASGTSTDAQRAHLPLKDLQVGDIIHLQVSRTAVENSSTIPFIHHIASRNIPVKIDEFKLLTSNPQMVIFDDYGPIEKSENPGGITWRIEEPVVVHNEKFMPLYQDFGAGVYVTTKQDWNSVGKNYYALIKHQFKNSIPVREKAFEIKGNRNLDADLIYATADWIRQNINYRAVEFGGHSLIPALSLATLNNRNGDCKDQSLLLLELLHTMGIKANLALIHLDEPGSMSLPTIQQFNHMIVHVPATDRWPELWIDPTDKSSSKRPVPLDLEDKVSLIIDSDSSHVRITPTLEKSQEHAADLHQQIYLSPNGKAEFKDSVVLQGKFASGLRNEMLKRDPVERKTYFQAWITQHIPDAVVVDVQVQNVHAFAQPLNIAIIYSSNHYFLRSAANIQAPLPNLWARAFMHLPQMKNRKHPIRLPHETKFNYRVTIHALGDAKVQLSAPQIPEVTNYTQQHFAVSDNNTKKVQYQGQWQTHSVYADPNEYLSLVAEWNAIVANTALNLRLTP